ncbi:MarR family transcriptional regulator [Tabrizicola sp.]|jgi:DNA-binding MarR family transcriptional regulator|uniref:MarR family winged helix-turn-helix transcriptional regulator n=1 Tax=Tabrizicola sp. TaxID=2005166 RepID=UPI0025F71EC7|nr:MarR family transcriptional regulator [Tabrizicola sp.]MBY0351907.1 MarR family transcriptional regulator [Tabrizicola sp.]MDK2773761.1 MarR family transcriptional regulator [Tabrizicola sp.]
MPDRNPTPEATLFAFFNEVGILAQLSRAMFEARLPPGFNLPQFAVLNHLIRVRDGQTPMALARAFQVPKTSMTHSLAVLERLGLIELRPNARDGRSKCVFLTDQGRGFRNDAVASLAPDMAAIAADYPVDRVESMLPALAALRKVMDARRDAQPADPET